MKIDSFSNSELEAIKIITLDYTINQKKDYIQDLVINRALSNKHTNMAFMFYTGFGKSRTATKIKDRFLIKFPNSKINMVSPSSLLQKKWALEKGINSYVINSFTMKFSEEKRNCDMLFVDELHHCLNRDSLYFSNLLKSNAKYKIGLSASLSKKHLEYLKNNNFTYVFDLPITVGTYLGLVPNYSIFNIPCSFSMIDKLSYIKQQEIIDKYLDLFSPLIREEVGQEHTLDKILSLVLLPKGVFGKYGSMTLTSSQWVTHFYNLLIENKVNIKEKDSIIFCAKSLKIAMINREKVIINCTNKNIVVSNILTKYNKSKSIVFTKSIDVSYLLESKLNRIGVKSKVYNSDITPKVKKLTMEEFEAGSIDSLVCINELKEGLDIAGIDLIIRHSFNGTQVDAQQILGRAVRYDESNPNKYAIVVNIYIKDFTYNNKLYLIAEGNKLEYAYRGLSCKWINEVEDMNDYKEETI
jgi:superfamily II DNA or RNA helicase